MRRKPLNWRRVVLRPLMIIWLVGGAQIAYAQPELVDDFNDRNDAGWTHWTYTNGISENSLLFDCSNGSYILRSAEPVPPGDLNEIHSTNAILMTTWDASSDPRYADGHFRFKIRIAEELRSGWIVLRAKPPYWGDGAGYCFFANTWCNCFGIEKGANGQYFLMTETLTGLLQPGQVWWMEAGAVGNRLSLKVWAEDGQEPDRPQLEVTDFDQPFMSGQIGLAARAFMNTTPAYVHVEFDDVYFTPALPFIRGDSNIDGLLGIADAVFTLGHLFAGESPPPCLDSADANDDGALDISDAITTLWYLFRVTDNLPEPFVACDHDPTSDDLSCLEYPWCEDLR